MKTKSKISPLRISPVFGPKLGEDQKKVFTQILSLSCAQTFCPSYKGGGGGMPQFCILFNPNYTILATPKGGMAPCPPPLNTPLFAIPCNCDCWNLTLLEQNHQDRRLWIAIIVFWLSWNLAFVIIPDEYLQVILYNGNF